MATERSEQLNRTRGAGPRDAVFFAPPGPGMSELETGHHGRRPLSGFFAETYRRAHEEGSVIVCQRYGLPLDRVQAGLVHGCLYLRPVGVGQGDKGRPVPPVALMKILARVHPEPRRRNRAAGAEPDGSLLNVLASPVQAVPWQAANPLLWYTPDRLDSAAASTIANAAARRPR